MRMLHAYKIMLHVNCEARKIFVCVFFVVAAAVVVLVVALSAYLNSAMIFSKYSSSVDSGITFQGRLVRRVWQ